MALRGGARIAVRDDRSYPKRCVTHTLPATSRIADPHTRTTSDRPLSLVAHRPISVEAPSHTTRPECKTFVADTPRPRAMALAALLPSVRPVVVSAAACTPPKSTNRKPPSSTRLGACASFSPPALSNSSYFEESYHSCPWPSTSRYHQAEPAPRGIWAWLTQVSATDPLLWCRVWWDGGDLRRPAPPAQPAAATAHLYAAAAAHAHPTWLPPASTTGCRVCSSRSSSVRQATPRPCCPPRSSASCTSQTHPTPWVGRRLRSSSSPAAG